MSWIAKLLGRHGVGRDSWLVELRTTRLRHLLAGLGAIVDLAGDAADKQDGDYILDRQYVLSLAEQALDRADAVLFDLEVIAGEPSPAGGDRLLALRRRVQEALARPPAADVPAGGDGDLADEPEYLLLREVRRELFAATLAAGTPAEVARCGSLLELAQVAAVEAGGHVGSLLRRDTAAPARSAPVAAGGAARLAVVDLGGALAPAGSGETRRGAAGVTGAALAALVAGIAEAPAPVDVEMHAAATAEHLFLAAPRAAAGSIVVDALLGASPETSHLFVAVRGSAAAAAGPLRLAGHEGTLVGDAAVLWRRGLDASRMAAALRAAGRLAAALPGAQPTAEEAR